MRSCLEEKGEIERKNEIIRSDYNKENQYSLQHKDAISDGDIQGKGSNNIHGHSFWKPHYYHGAPDYKNVFKYDNFDTSNESNIGGCYDIDGRKDNGGRKKAIKANIFNQNYQYNANIIGNKRKN